MPASQSKEPHYQITYKLHLPIDPPWRKENRNIHRVSVGHEPEKVWVAAVYDLLQMLGFGRDEKMLGGLLLNLINSFPEQMRGAIAYGIIDGQGLQLTAEGDEVKASIETLFDSLPVGGQTRRASGLIIPGGETPDA